MGAAAAKNEYSLPESDVCYNTLEDFNNFTAVRINDFYRAFYYAQLGERIEQGLACCPELGEEALKYRPETTDWQALQKFELPSRILRNNDSCGKHLFESVRDHMVV